MEVLWNVFRRLIKIGQVLFKEIRPGEEDDFDPNGFDYTYAWFWQDYLVHHEPEQGLTKELSSRPAVCLAGVSKKTLLKQKLRK